MSRRMGSEGDMLLFDVIARAGSFASAARELGMTPGAISRRVKTMEERLGVHLFSRTTRSLKLTEPGQIFAARCAEVAQSIKEAEVLVAREAQDPGGLVRLGVSASLAQELVLPRLREFCESHPAIRVDLVTGGSNLSIHKDKLDALVIASEPQETSIIGKILFRSPWVTVASPAYLSRHDAPEHPEDLLEHSCLVPVNLAGELRDRWSYRGEKGPVIVQPRPYISGLSIHLFDLCKSGLGIARLPAHLVTGSIAQGDLVSVLDHYPSSERRQVYLQYPRVPYRSYRATLLIDFLTASLDDVAAELHRTATGVPE
ncbi:LysR family transcriptional regulator [Henriciella sp.]|uniref:LysR family transcriptional regulator n=1 Tax=Henriciella sp. TaxID=1968823 RepID=UPI002629AE52|nr:LysR family transcriptional regulator [Henriciella sp.]